MVCEGTSMLLYITLSLLLYASSKISDNFTHKHLVFLFVKLIIVFQLFLKVVYRGLRIALLWIWTSPVAYCFENNSFLRKGPPLSVFQRKEDGDCKCG